MSGGRRHQIKYPYTALSQRLERRHLRLLFVRCPIRSCPVISNGGLNPMYVFTFHFGKGNQAINVEYTCLTLTRALVPFFASSISQFTHKFTSGINSKPSQALPVAPLRARPIGLAATAAIEGPTGFLGGFRAGYTLCSKTTSTKLITHTYVLVFCWGHVPRAQRLTS